MSLQLSLLVLGMSVFGAGCAPGADAESEPAAPVEPPRNVRVVELHRLELEEHLTISGPVRPLAATDISSEETGIVASIERKKGSRVRRGEPVILLDRALLGAELAAARADREMQEYDEERMRTLFEANSVSRQEKLMAETQAERARAAEAIAQLRYERAAIKAPFDGMVSDRAIEPGQMVNPGQIVARVIDPFTLKLVGGVTEREVRYIKEGSPAVVSFDGSDELAQGRVSWIAFEANPSTGKFEIEIQVDNRELRWRSGIVARARVLKKLHGAVLAVPRDALVQRPASVAVFVVEDDIARERTVTLGPDQSNMVMITSGLDEGEQVVVRGQRELHDGSRVRVQERADHPDGSLNADPDVVKQSRATSSAEEISSGGGRR